MIKQWSQYGKGMILTLLILGLSYKGSYGEVPVNLNKFTKVLDLKNSSELFSLNQSNISHINSFFVQNNGRDSNAMIMLFVYDEKLAKTVQEILKTKQVPLLVSISTLPFQKANFDPQMLQFEQDQGMWSTHLKNDYNFFTLFDDSKFGGEINDGDIHQGIILLPKQFDIHRSITIHYLNNKREFSF